MKVKEIQWEAMQYTSSVAKESISVRDWCTNDVINAFKVGAQWQKEQMMKDALDSTIVDDGLYKSIVPTMQAMLRYNKGDKVKVIIIKED